MSKCVKCQREFHCEMSDGEAGQACWCFALPVIPTGALVEAGGDGSACFCPECLRAIAEQAGLPVT
jgi:hypothetical protein